MAISDGLIISLVGISVVFGGLLITSWLIAAISLVPVWLERRRQMAPPPAAVVKESVPQAILPVPPPDTAAVIAALLEVEMRLHGGDRASRFTFSRGALPPTRGAENAIPPNPPKRGAR